jgi:hypothetical protein
LKKTEPNGLKIKRFADYLVAKMKGTFQAIVRVAVVATSVVSGFVVQSSSTRTNHHQLNAFTVPGMWPAGLNFGKGSFSMYKSFDDFMKPFTDNDRAAYPEVFNLPKGVYEVSLQKPLGIVFEEIEVGKGVFVQELVEGGNAERSGKIQPGDILVAVTAVKIVGARWERRLIPARKFDFDTVVGAIGSNEEKWSCFDVVCMFERPGEADSAKTDEFLEFFEPPFDNPWKQQQ